MPAACDRGLAAAFVLVAWTALAAASAHAAPSSPRAAREAALLVRYRPLLRYDRSESQFATAIESLVARYRPGGGLTESARLVAASGEVIAAANPRLGLPVLRPDLLGRRYRDRAGPARADDRVLSGSRARGGGRPLAYGRSLPRPGGGRWLQYWLFYLDNPQDRGVLRTGRHEGDWELVQLRLDPADRPVRATLRAHMWAQGCARTALWQDRSGAPVVFVAKGSHANYSRPGVHDRPWPDPNDEADGRGRALRPPVEPISGSPQDWLAWPGRWGGSHASIVPGEQSSPRGPAFQPEWSDPAGLERQARGCTASPPGRPWQAPLAIALLALALAACFGRWRRRAGPRP